jgi:mRNA-degrading endonuclease HigB of HigAB toxin-antitoxin module
MKAKPTLPNFFRNLGQDYKEAGKDIYNISSDLIKGIKNKQYKSPCEFIKTAFKKARDFTLNHALVTTITIVALTLISLVTFQLLLIIPLALAALAISNGTPFFKALIHESTCLFPCTKNAKETILGNNILNADAKRSFYKNISYKHLYALEIHVNKVKKTANDVINITKKMVNKGIDTVTENINNFLGKNPNIETLLENMGIL